MNDSLKGIKNGNCNRTSCQAPNAVWYNHSTEKYYCSECAHMLNDDNRIDAQKLYGHELCTSGEEKSSKLKKPSKVEKSPMEKIANLQRVVSCFEFDSREITNKVEIIKELAKDEESSEFIIEFLKIQKEVSLFMKKYAKVYAKVYDM